MAINPYDKGDVVRVTGTFTNAAGTAIDPTAVLFSFINPAATTTTYTYGTDAELVKSATGVYYVDLALSAEGRYYYRFYSTGTGAAGGEGSLICKESHF